jgi:hypothetical protein
MPWPLSGLDGAARRAVAALALDVPRTESGSSTLADYLGGLDEG